MVGPGFTYTDYFSNFLTQASQTPVDNNYKLVLINGHITVAIAQDLFGEVVDNQTFQLYNEDLNGTPGLGLNGSVSEADGKSTILATDNVWGKQAYALRDDPPSGSYVIETWISSNTSWAGTRAGLFLNINSISRIEFSSSSPTQIRLAYKTGGWTTVTQNVANISQLGLRIVRSVGGFWNFYYNVNNTGWVHFKATQYTIGLSTLVPMIYLENIATKGSAVFEYFTMTTTSVYWIGENTAKIFSAGYDYAGYAGSGKKYQFQGFLGFVTVPANAGAEFRVGFGNNPTTPALWTSFATGSALDTLLASGVYDDMYSYYFIEYKTHVNSVAPNSSTDLTQIQVGYDLVDAEDVNRFGLGCMTVGGTTSFGSLAGKLEA